MKGPNVMENTALARQLNSLARMPNAWQNRIIATRKTIAAIGPTSGTAPTPVAKILHHPLVPTANLNAPTFRLVSTKVSSVTKWPIVRMKVTSLFFAASTNVST